MKKSINLWAFPYPDRWSLRACMKLAKEAGFDGVELNYDLENDLSPKSGPAEFRVIRQAAEEIGIAISGICSFLYWPYSLTDSDSARRARGMELARLMISAAHELGTANLLTIAGSTYIPWIPEREGVPFDVCARRARGGRRAPARGREIWGLAQHREHLLQRLPHQSRRDECLCRQLRLRAHRCSFDTGNIMLFQFPEHWIPILGHRIRNVHFKEFSKKGTDHSLDSFRTLLDGTTNWPAVMQALDAIGYRGYLTFEYFHPFAYYPEALIYQTCDALDRIMGRKV
jgi:hexulose-6-phosphate isomerase